MVHSSKRKIGLLSTKEAAYSSDKCYGTFQGSNYQFPGVCSASNKPILAYFEGSHKASGNKGMGASLWWGFETSPTSVVCETMSLTGTGAGGGT